MLANGGFLSKEAAGVYSTTPPAAWAPVSSDDLHPSPAGYAAYRQQWADAMAVAVYGR